MKLYVFRTVPLSIIRSYSLYTQQWYMSYRFVGSFRAAGSGLNCISILILLLLESRLQTCMTYTIAECTVNNSWWWTEEMSETCRASFPKQIWGIGASSLFYYKDICHDARPHECKHFIIFIELTQSTAFIVVCVHQPMASTEITEKYCLLPDQSVWHLRCINWH
jgi:hypothetical protein